MNLFSARPLVATITLAGCFLMTACGSKGPPSERVGSLASPGGSATEILERDDMTMAAVTMEELIKDRLPNVLIRRSGGRTWVEIRGPGTISSGTEALIIIDGIQNTSRGLLSMNPSDVQRIQVLKDGSAAIYGMRAGNGVLLVTTRREGQ